MQTHLSDNTNSGNAPVESAQPEARQPNAERTEPTSTSAAGARKERIEAKATLPHKDFRHRAGKAISYARGSWLGRNWYTITVLFFLVLLGLFVRSYFGVEPATENGFLLSGGSDSYYHQRAYLYAFETGDHLHFEDMLNYPMGTRNPRAPIYDWSIYIGGEALSPLFNGDAVESMWWVFIYSTAVWGALTAIPTYFLAKEAFGKKAGYIAAFLIAIMPGHIQRSVLTNADHDAISLFFIVTAFYFFLKALKNLKTDVYVESWRDFKGAFSGIRNLINENQVSVLFSLLSGFSFLAVALTWQGYAYMLVIVTAYFGIQILVNRFRNVNSLGVIMVYAISVGTITLLAFPYYYLSVQIASWYDAPAYMFLGALGFGVTLEVTRKYPWLLVLSVIALAAVVAVLSLYLFWDSMYHTLIGAIASGAGYFVRNKQYETIAEAQAPAFSNLALSFGVVTFWLSLVGIAYAIYQLPKKLKFDYIFIVVWTATSIYMAVSAARFMFNAAPAFAVTAGWIVAVIIDKLNIRDAIEQQRRAASGFNNDWEIFRTMQVVGLVLGVSGLGAYLYMDSLAPISIAAVAIMTIAFLVYARGMRSKWYYLALGLIPLAVTAALYGLYYDDFVKDVDHIAVPLLSAFGFVILVVQIRGALLRTTAGVLFLAFMVVIPNVWGGVDAGIPYEVKADYDKDIYNAIPSAFTPESYDAVNGTNWYLGGFGYSLPLNTQYYPAAYDWLATQDADKVIPEERPAYLSWWDYGFEAVNEGKHPTVADNFLGGHQLAGNFIMAQNESNAVSLLIARLIEADWVRNRNSVRYGDASVEGFLSADVIDILESYGLDESVFDNAIKNPSDYVDHILANPDIYSPRDSAIQNVNAQYLVSMGYIATNLDEGGIANLYHDLCDATGWSIRYFAIDSRLFPFSGENTGIFYAPAKLSDHRMKEPNQPYDFFEIKAVGEYGGEYALEDVPDDVNIVSYKLEYKDMFFNSMLYRCVAGYSGKDIGGTNTDGIPGLNGTLTSSEPMQGWNLTHFRRVYRTAYYNPYPSGDVANHTDAWRAVNYDEAVEMKKKIQAGTLEGIVDDSGRSAMYQGVTFLKYYDGAIVSGKITLKDGTPLEGAYVTVYDEYSIPHHIVQTDAEGKYELLAPFGNVSVVASTGQLTLEKLVATKLNETNFYVRDDQAMRENVDMDSNGVWDYYITKDMVVEGAAISGKVYADASADGTFGDGDFALAGASVVISSALDGMESEAVVDEDGNYSFSDLRPGEYSAEVVYKGTVMAVNSTLPVGGGASATKDFPIGTITLSGNVILDNQEAVKNASVAISDEYGEIVDMVDTYEDGSYNTTLVAGNYYIRAQADDGLWSQTRFFKFEGTGNKSVNMTVFDSAFISGVLKAGGIPRANLSFTMFDLHDKAIDVVVRTDANGTFAEFVPFGEYTIYASYTAPDGRQYAYLGDALVDGTNGEMLLDMTRAGKVYGVATDNIGTKLVNAAMSIHGEGTIELITNANGEYSAVLPAGAYTIYMALPGATPKLFSLTSTQVVAGTSVMHDIFPGRGIAIGGRIYQDVNGNGTYDAQEGLPFSKAVFTDADGVELPILTDYDGEYSGIISASEEYILTLESRGYKSVIYSGLIGSELAKTTLYEMSEGDISVSGTVIPESDELPVGGQVLKFTSHNGDETLVPVLLDGTFTTDLKPGQYEIYMSGDLTGNGSMDIAYQLDLGAARLDLTPGTGDLEIELDARSRVRAKVSVMDAGDYVQAGILFSGPEDYIHTMKSNASEDIYLIPGEYSIMARDIKDDGGNSTWGDLITMEKATVSAGTELVLNLTDSNVLSGTVLHQGASKSGFNVTLTDVETGVHVETTSDENGQYEMKILPGRDYTITVNQSAAETVGEATVHYLYSALVSTITNAVGNTSLNVQLNRVYDNVTVTGRLLRATGFGSQTLEFLAADESGIDAVADVDDSGGFSVDIAPGSYFVYAFDALEKKVALVKLNINTSGIETLLIDMYTGLKLSGNIYFRDSTPVETEVSIDIGALTNLKLFSSAGFYEKWLPSGTYNISAERRVTEWDREVRYSHVSTVKLESNLRYSIELTRATSYGAKIEWDSAQNVPVAPGANQTYYFTIENTGNLPDTFVMNSLGDEGWMTKLSADEVYLLPGEKTTMTIAMTVSEDVKVEHIPVTVTAESKDNPTGAAVTKEMEVNVTQTHAVTATPSATAAVETSEGFSLAVKVSNPGNGKDSYDISIGNIEELIEKGWSVDWSPSASLGGNISGNELRNVSVASDAEAEVTFTILRNGTKSSSIDSVKLYVRSAAEPNAFDTVEVDVRSGLLTEGSVEPSATGERVTDVNPDTQHLTEAVVAFAVVGIILAVYFYMRKRRWLA